MKEQPDVDQLETEFPVANRLYRYICIPFIPVYMYTGIPLKTVPDFLLYRSSTAGYTGIPGGGVNFIYVYTGINGRNIIISFEIEISPRKKKQF